MDDNWGYPPIYMETSNIAVGISWDLFGNTPVQGITRQDFRTDLRTLGYEL